MNRISCYNCPNIKPYFTTHGFVWAHTGSQQVIKSNIARTNRGTMYECNLIARFIPIKDVLSALYIYTHVYVEFGYMMMHTSIITQEPIATKKEHKTQEILTTTTTTLHEISRLLTNRKNY